MELFDHRIAFSIIELIRGWVCYHPNCKNKESPLRRLCLQSPRGHYGVCWQRHELKASCIIKAQQHRQHRSPQCIYEQSKGFAAHAREVVLAKPIGTVSAFKEAEVQSKTNVEQKDLYDPLPKKVLDKFQNSECNENIHKNNDEGITCSDLWH